MLQRVAGDRLRRERRAIFIGIDRLVLRAMIRKQPLDVLHPPDRPDVPDDEQQPDNALDHVAEEWRFKPGERVEPIGGSGRRQEEQPDGNRHRHGDSAPCYRPGELAFIAHRHIGGEGQRTHTQPERVPQQAKPAHKRHPAPEAVVQRRVDRLLTDHDLTIRRAYRERHVPAAAHHHALNNRLAAVVKFLFRHYHQPSAHHHCSRL